MQNKKTINDQVYDAILENIVLLKYEPGEKLSEVQLSEELEVSRAPIKSALAKLEKEGFVKIKPQYGTFVSEISVKRAREICDIRILLETYAVQIAVEKITEVQIEEMQKLIEKMDQMHEDNEEKKQFIYSVDGKLHDMIYRISGNDVIEEIIGRYRPEIQRIQIANMTWANRKEATQEEMRNIVTALRNHDQQEAANAMRAHLSHIKDAIEGYNEK